MSWNYQYDPIGNRTTATEGAAPATTDYLTNELNQYFRSDRDTPRIGQGFRYDADGNLVEQYAVGDMDCDGDADFWDIDCFMEALGRCPDPNYACLPCNCLNGDLDGDGDVDFYDRDPFRPHSGRRRVVRAQPPYTTACAVGSDRTRCTFDGLRRRLGSLALLIRRLAPSARISLRPTRALSPRRGRKSGRARCTLLRAGARSGCKIGRVRSTRRRAIRLARAQRTPPRSGGSTCRA